MLLPFLLLTSGALLFTGRLVEGNPLKDELVQLIENISTAVAEDVFTVDQNRAEIVRQQQVGQVIELMSQRLSSRLEPQIKRLYEILLAPVKERVKVKTSSMALRKEGSANDPELGAKVTRMAQLANRYIEKLFRLNYLS